MKRTSAAVITVFLGLATALVACAGDPTPVDPCDRNPKAKGCGGGSAAPATTASTYVSPVIPNTPPPSAFDAGPDARPHKPDAGSVVPPAAVACTDLLRCCANVKDTIERAACLGIGYNASPDTCANAIIAYQVFGGCGHDPVSLPDIFNSDGTENTSNDCTYLEQACQRDPSQCDAAYACDGTTYSDPSGYEPPAEDPCGYWSSETKANGQNDYDCCVFNDVIACCGDDNAGCQEF
jgi:hypothetical protein